MKRSLEDPAPVKSAKADESSTPREQEGREEIAAEFDGSYVEELDSEEEIFEAGDGGLPDNDDEDLDDEPTTEPARSQRIYLPHRTAPLGKNEVMEPDYSTYDMLHSVNVKWPCLSFDILPDHLGVDRTGYPQTIYMVSGTQAQRPKDNEINVLKLSSLAKTLVKDDEDDEDDEDYDSDPILESRTLPAVSTVNRIRISPFASTTAEYLAASMHEDGNVNIWDVSPQFQSFDSPGSLVSKPQRKAVHTIKSHGRQEGYAVDWSPLQPTGWLLTGDGAGKIFLTKRTNSGWITEKEAFVGSDASVEDLQWSPTEKAVFASGGGDGTIRIWDARQTPGKAAIEVKATSTDINVMSWNRKAAHLLATGHDDGQFAVWDLRNFTQGKPVADFSFHKQAISSIEWHPTDESVLAAASEDNTVTLWDFSVEADDEEVAQQTKEARGELDEIPSQLLFVHWQPHVKEVHWHRQIPGALVSTGSDGFSLWKTISV